MYKANWERNFQCLSVFKNQEGNCVVPLRHQEGDIKLGSWVVDLRRFRSTLSEENVTRLSEIGFTWDLLESRWESNYECLVNFYNREGHSIVQRKHVENGNKLGDWVHWQRVQINKDLLSAEKIERLGKVDFIVDVAATSWQKYFEKYAEFKQREGHCNMRYNHIEDGLKLGSWQQNQRTRRNKLPANRRDALDEIGFIWNTLEDQT